MAQKRAFEVDGWLARPDPAISLVLIYGPDRGLVSERALAYARKLGLALDDPFAVVRLDAGSMEPGGLADEAATVPMFSPKRLIWLRDAGPQKAVLDDVKALALAPPRDAVVLIEAGDLRKGAPLRAAVEASPTAMALPCYPDDARDLDRLIDEELGRQNHSIQPAARQLLHANLGGDRKASRGELEKLSLYALGKREITLDDVKALTGDVSAAALDEVADAVVDGRSADADAAIARHGAAAAQAGSLFFALSRQLLMLHRMRADIDAGKGGPASVVAAARPPLFHARRGAMERALSTWTRRDIEEALARLHGAVLETRQRPDLAAATIRQLVLTLALRAAGRRRSAIS